MPQIEWSTTDNDPNVGKTTFHTRLAISQVVYHVQAQDDEPGIITGILIRAGCVIYYVTWPDRTETLHYPFELSTDRTNY